MFFNPFHRQRNKELLNRLYGEIVAAARQPSFYLDYGVEDTFEGRFEMVTLIGGFTTHYFSTLPRPGRDLAQDVTDMIFQGFDQALREYGTADVAMSKKMRRLTEAYLGRIQTYVRALSQDARQSQDLENALGRNILENRGNKWRLAAYVRTMAEQFQGVTLENLGEKSLPFPQAKSILASHRDT